jgi:hypothetical protein
MFDLGVSATKINDISDEAFIGQGFAGIERLPEIELNSDTSRLGTSLPYGIPVRMNFSAGRFKEFPDAVESDRFFMQLDTSAQRFKLSNRLALTGSYMPPGANVNGDIGVPCVRILLAVEGFNMPVAISVSVIDNPRLTLFALGGSPCALSDCHSVPPLV